MREEANKPMVDGMKEENEYDVVVETLQKEIDSLWKMTEKNMKSGMMNIMDDIRLDQIDQLKSAIELWKNRNENT